MPPEKGSKLQYIDKEYQVQDSTETQDFIVNDPDRNLLDAKVSCRRAVRSGSKKKSKRLRQLM
jgi:hypothetical protein